MSRVKLACKWCLTFHKREVAYLPQPPKKNNFPWRLLENPTISPKKTTRLIRMVDCPDCHISFRGVKGAGPSVTFPKNPS